MRLYLDTFNDRRRAAFFGVNGLGVQEDGLRSETGTSAGSLFGGQDDLNVDYLWDSKGRRTERGYEVEVRIPFKSLQYAGSGPQDWGFNAVRYVQRSGYEDTWTDVRRANSSFLAQEGVLTGLEGMQRGLVFEAQPFVTAGWAGAQDAEGNFNRDDPEPSAGINLQLATTTLAFDGTVNPDFSQVESDQGLITVNERFALYVPEKRPFFLKGIDLFSTPGQLIYTRRIFDPIGGAKVTGKLGRNSIAYLGSVDDLGATDAWFSLLRVRRDLGENSVAGLTYTDRIEGSAYNRLVEGDAHIVFAKLYFVEAQYGQSWTSLDDGNGTVTDPIWKLTFDRTGRTWGFNYTINGIGTDFIAGSGFVPRNDIVTAHIFNRLSFYGAKGALLENFTTFFGPTWLYEYDGFTQNAPIEGNQEVTFQFTLRGGWELSAKTEQRVHHLRARVLLRAGDRPGRAVRAAAEPRQSLRRAIVRHDAHLPAVRRGRQLRVRAHAALRRGERGEGRRADRERQLPAQQDAPVRGAAGLRHAGARLRRLRVRQQRDPPVQGRVPAHGAALLSGHHRVPVHPPRRTPRSGHRRHPVLQRACCRARWTITASGSTSSPPTNRAPVPSPSSGTAPSPPRPTRGTSARCSARPTGSS